MATTVRLAILQNGDVTLAAIDPQGTRPVETKLSNQTEDVHAPVDGKQELLPHFVREQMLSLSQAARRLPHVRGQKPPHPHTLARWASPGRKTKSGQTVRLEVWRIGGTVCTSIEALQRFFDRLNDVPVADPQQVDDARRLAHKAEMATTELRRRGLIR